MEDVQGVIMEHDVSYKNNITVNSFRKHRILETASVNLLHLPSWLL